MGWRVGDLPSPSLGSALGLLPCPNCNQLEIFFKSHPIEPFEIKICLLMGNLHFIVKRELSSFLALAANPGRVLVGAPLPRCPWAAGWFPASGHRGFLGAPRNLREPTAMERCPAKKIRRSCSRGTGPRIVEGPRQHPQARLRSHCTLPAPWPEPLTHGAALGLHPGAASRA